MVKVVKKTCKYQDRASACDIGIHSLSSSFICMSRLTISLHNLSAAPSLKSQLLHIMIMKRTATRTVWRMLAYTFVYIQICVSADNDIYILSNTELIDMEMLTHCLHADYTKFAQYLYSRKKYLQEQKTVSTFLILPAQRDNSDKDMWLHPPINNQIIFLILRSSYAHTFPS